MANSTTRAERNTTNASRPHLSLASTLGRRLATVALWYVTLTIPFLLILGWASTYESATVAYVVSGAPAMSWLTPAEQSHMADVHELVRQGVMLFLSAAIILTAYLATRRLDRGMLRAVLAMHLALLVLFIPFPWTFIRFHEIFFPQGNWTFPADSWLITHFNETFFGIVAFAWFAMAIASVWLVRYLLPSPPRAMPRTEPSRQRRA